MIEFDHLNPFPILNVGTYSYAEAKAHAILVDEWLQYDLAKIENQIAEESRSADAFPQERWIGLDPQSFLTPYIEIRTMLDLLSPKMNQKVIDLGCGYGRMAHVMGKHYPYVSFIGYEIVPQRVKEAQRTLACFSYSLARIEQRNLVETEPEAADFYFIYDYGSQRAIEKTLQDLKWISMKRPIKVVARGRGTRFLVHRNHPWLAEVNEPQHFETFSIFTS